MRTSLRPYRNAIFFASGFAGLIYESIWTHYLKLFLGHAAYAQTFVLAIFMGGMAIGAAVAARYTARIGNPLAAYALIEGAIGILAIAFHPLFTGTTGSFYDIAFAQHLEGIPFAAIKWSLAVLLILPQSILLGATFPVFAAAATRDAPNAEGRSIATLYFANSIGGAAGVLASGFLLVPWVGLFGTIAVAGTVNLLLAAVVMALLRASPAAVPATPGASARAATAPLASPPRAVDPGTAVTLLLATSMLTGASSFIYEIGWIRMLSLVLGSATHSFELMLSSFVLGLALGGLWIRKRVDTARNPGVLLGSIQIVMGCAALATIPLHSASFDLVGYVVRETAGTERGYALFNLVRYGVASLIMFPAAFCAGMTLPLITGILYSQQRQGERAIGLVYSANTVGAIVGLGAAVHFGLPVLGLSYLVASGAMIDVLLGAVLLVVFGGRARLRYALVAAAGCVAGSIAAAQTFNPQKLASGVFRTGQANADATVVDIAHGKTATISIDSSGDVITIRTNGKPDASASLRPPAHTPDQVTAMLSAAIPLMLLEAPRRVANIGLGSGVTGDALLADPRVVQLDTIEIEPKVVLLATRFGDLNRSIYTDPRSAIHIEDAKSFFASNGKTYDLIVSEPSNPWVSGVAGLFSVEFYQHVSRYLNEDGLFAQWLQTYETHPDRVASVLKALSASFDDYLVVSLDRADILLIAKPHGKVVLPPDAYARISAALRQRLDLIDVANQSDIIFRIIGNKAMLEPWLQSRDAPANSDFFPYLDSNADRDRYLGKSWPELQKLALTPYPIAEVLGARPPLRSPSSLSINLHFADNPPWLAARMVKESLLGPATGPESIPIPSNLPEAFLGEAVRIIAACEDPLAADSSAGAARLATRVVPYLAPGEGRGVLGALSRAPCLGEPPVPQAQWPALAAAIAGRNAAGFGGIADRMLVDGQGTTEVRTRYLLAMAMLGHIGSGNPARARELWAQFSRQATGSNVPELTLQVLRAHAEAPATQR